MNPEKLLIIESREPHDIVETSYGPHGVGLTVTVYKGPAPALTPGWRATRRRGSVDVDSATMRKTDPKGDTWTGFAPAPWVD